MTRIRPCGALSGALVATWVVANAPITIHLLNNFLAAAPATYAREVLSCSLAVLPSQRGLQAGLRGDTRRLSSHLVSLQAVEAGAIAPGRSGPEAEQGISLRWLSDPYDNHKAAVEVAGLSAVVLQELLQSDWTQPQWHNLLAVYAEQKSSTSMDLPPMSGSYRVRSGVIRFEPQFPLERGVTYKAVFRADRISGSAEGAGPKMMVSTFRLPTAQSNPTTVVSQVYPSAGVLPENLLKFYIHFTAPMSRGRIYDHIHLREETGKEIELPFLEIDEELWDSALTRLTLFIDPGRIKRGVRPLEEVGPALEAGKRYRLVIDRAWQDGVGNPLKEGFQKTFEVGPPDRDPPDPAHWKIHPPKPETREPLTVAFPESLDHTLAQRVIRVTDEAGELLEGKTALEAQERRWIFRPVLPWQRGSYKLVVETTLEDLAGNNIGKPFEVDVFERVQRRLTTPVVKLPFEIR